jgi:predicted nucleic acid-binding Zn ribbon protein
MTRPAKIMRLKVTPRAASTPTAAARDIKIVRRLTSAPRQQGLFKVGVTEGDQMAVVFGGGRSA